jgi:hypothetical protein
MTGRLPSSRHSAFVSLCGFGLCMDELNLAYLFMIRFGMLFAREHFLHGAPSRDVHRTRDRILKKLLKQLDGSETEKRPGAAVPIQALKAAA